MALSERRAAPTDTAKEALQRLIDGFQTLVREHLALAKVELKDDIRRMGRDVVLSAAGLPALFVGYVLFMAGIALVIALALPTWLAFLIVGVLNLGAGGALTAAFGVKARTERVGLPRTTEEIKRDKEWLASMGNGRSSHRPHTSEPLAEGRSGWGEAAEAMGGGETEEPGAARGDALPAGKAGATPDLGPRAVEPKRGQPVAGATSTPNGEAMMAQRPDVTH
jgi:uncharacterized membrane protein YqjE